jgi:hypothetical protein
LQILVVGLTSEGRATDEDALGAGVSLSHSKLR